MMPNAIRAIGMCATTLILMAVIPGRENMAAKELNPNVAITDATAIALNTGDSVDFFQGQPERVAARVGAACGRTTSGPSFLSKIGIGASVSAQSCTGRYAFCDSFTCQVSGCGSCHAEIDGMFGDVNKGYIPGGDCCTDQLCDQPPAP